MSVTPWSSTPLSYSSGYFGGAKQNRGKACSPPESFIGPKLQYAKPLDLEEITQPRSSTKYRDAPTPRAVAARWRIRAFTHRADGYVPALHITSSLISATSLSLMSKGRGNGEDNTKTPKLRVLRLEMISVTPAHLANRLLLCGQRHPCILGSAATIYSTDLPSRT